MENNIDITRVYLDEITKKELIFSNESNDDVFEVSLAVPSYQRTDLFLRLLRSISSLKTSLKFEVVITEDTREEKHIEIIRNFLSGVSFKVRYYKNVERAGLYRNWNQAILLSTGKYFCLVHTDDVLHPDFLRSYEKPLHQNDKAVIAQRWNYLYLVKDPNAIDSFLKCKQNFQYLEKRGFSFIFRGFGIPLLGTMIRKDCLSLVGMFPSDPDYWSTMEDYFFMVKIVLHFPVYQLSSSCYGYVVEDNCMLTCDGWNDSIVNCYYLRLQMVASMPKISKFKSYFYVLLAKVKVVIETYERSRWNKKFSSSKEKMDKKMIYNRVRLPIVIRLLAPSIIFFHLLHISLRNSKGR